MKYFFYFLLISIVSNRGYSQKIDSVDIPKGVIYNYCKASEIKSAEIIIRKELDKKPDYELIGDILWIGPILWARYKEVNALSTIKGGNTTLLVDDKKLSAKMTQNIPDGKKIWDQLHNEINNSTYSIRKANYKEIKYYWSVIAFDIDEPLLIVETSKHRYILNFFPKTMKLVWLDEAP